MGIDLKLRKRATIRVINSIIFSTILVVSILLLVNLVFAASVDVKPSTPTSMRYVGNRSTDYNVLGTNYSLNRGYIHIINFTESQPTIKWIGIIGNISGQYALQDASGNELYDWDIVTTTGEVYATKEGTSGRGNYYGGGIPVWDNLTCASHTLIKNETFFFDHSGSSEDALNKTFVPSFTLTTFYAGSRRVMDANVTTPAGDGGYEAKGSDTCAGAYMNVNNADQSADFLEVMLTDQTYQVPTDLEHRQYDILYASLIENNTVGYDGNTYDFQMILPQSGLQGNPANVIYYFYIELV